MRLNYQHKYRYYREMYMYKLPVKRYAVKDETIFKYKFLTPDLEEVRLPKLPRRSAYWLECVADPPPSFCC